MIRVLLAESQLLFQDALRLTLEAKEGISIVDAADNGIEAVEKVIQYQPDVILMNFHLTEKDGVQATKEIKEANPETKVILLTSEYEEDNLIKGLIYGADGILHNKIESDSLERAIKTVNEGDTFLSKDIANGLRHEIYKLFINKKELLHEALERENIFLTSRELDVADLFRFGLNNEQIAKRLSLSEGTIKNYISNIYQALGIHNRSEAIEYIYQLLKKVDKSYF
ncbi:response regulator transcription factor [Virgibacillus sp. MSJ-26]|uniref:response regulator transcription factor n=1 Tax=Virgibacillus sp. MSJ-26 TaxID=2841522 RepID=UPI001C10AE28|nr:response regulator transcription factor [Virgibacillus sp. MSJ-26]MBU5465525.1 response regulator transcription factor [Virgibacillus sp. MSJ-26]